AGVLESAFPIIIPAADPQSLYVVQQYLSLGGTLRDRSGAVALSTTVLTELLDYYSAARAAAVLTQNTLEFGSGAETWSAYRELRAPLVITNAHSYLEDAAMASNTRAGPAPTQSGKPYALAEVWSYALVSTDITRESSAWKLLDWLLQPQNLGAWALKAGYLPPRAEAVDSWPPEAPTDFARQVLAASHSRPDTETLALLGPPLGKAVRNVIRGHATTSTATQDVILEISTH
ncbi:MAG: extracellular solute-binding protein, partial [Anaerolineales bacterium]|nr:extracellular solute-binding protein [Anaerolineales bacterium]